MSEHAGRFVWFELATPDKDASRRFYTGLFGWQWQIEDLGPAGVYPMFAVGEEFIGGLVTPRPEGAPAQWLSYVTVPDLDVALVEAQRLGGKLLAPARAIPQIGRFAVVADPRGAVILPFQSLNPPPPEPPPSVPAGRFCWHELLTSDPEPCGPFYRSVFGWEQETSAMEGFGVYHVFRRGTVMEAGMMQMPQDAEGGAPSHWLPYVASDDIAGATARIPDLGGRILCPPTDIPGMGRFTVAADPHGAAFAVFQAS